jgi:hypothetical protein
VQGHTYPQLTNCAPVFGDYGSLGSEGGSDGIGSSRKGSLYRIANRFEVDAAMRGNRDMKKRNVARHGRGHRLSVPLPEGGAALDIGEEKGNRPAWQLSHAAISGPF